MVVQSNDPSRINLSEFMPGGKGWKKIAPGPRLITRMGTAAPTLVAFGAAGLFYGLFFTSSWFGKNVLEQIPIYNKKYAERDPD